MPCFRLSIVQFASSLLCSSCLPYPQKGQDDTHKSLLSRMEELLRGCWSQSAWAGNGCDRIEKRPFWRRRQLGRSELDVLAGAGAAQDSTRRRVGIVTSTGIVADGRLPCGLLASQVSDLLFRDITPEDYDLLLQLDESLNRPTASQAMIEKLPVARNKDVHGQRCAVCMMDFGSSDAITQLQCKHAFHKECIGRWLVERCRVCPLCQEEVTQGI
mmetsp:Transcript_22183/g.50701  ORF Transcript_22183/g.50701 Transcript_22183/m.50701 type:complete len:215 (+) Transcript_22183:177-821(+)